MSGRSELHSQWRATHGVLAVALLLAAGVQGCARSEDDPQKVLEQRIAQTKAQTNAKGDLAAKKKLAANAEEKADLAEYKDQVLKNLDSVKEMFAKAEEAWKNQKYKEATSFYQSVALATVAGAEDMVETARGRLLELEDLAKEHLKTADDADITRDYLKEVDELAFVTLQLPDTKAREVADRRLRNLTTRADVAAHLEVKKAETAEAEGRFSDALALYNAVATNLRYENTLGALRAKRKLDSLNSDENLRAKLKAEVQAHADKEAPILLANAHNFVLNHQPKLALEKLQIVLDKFPGTPYAEAAQKQLDELK